MVPDYDLFDIGGFVYTQKAINKITLSGGARYDNRNLNAKNLLEGFLEFSGRYRILAYNGSQFSQLGTIFQASLLFKF